MGSTTLLFRKHGRLATPVCSAVQSLAATVPLPSEPQGPRRNPAGLTQGRQVIGSHGPQRAQCDLFVGQTHLGPSRLQMQETLSARRVGSGEGFREKPAGSLRGGTEQQGRFTPNPYAVKKPHSPGVCTCLLGCVREEGEGKTRRACLCMCVRVCLSCVHACARSRTSVPVPCRCVCMPPCLVCLRVQVRSHICACSVCVCRGHALHLPTPCVSTYVLHAVSPHPSPIPWRRLPCRDAEALTWDRDLVEGHVPQHGAQCRHPVCVCGAWQALEAAGSAHPSAHHGPPCATDLRKEMKFCRGQPRGPTSVQWEGAHTAACRACAVSIPRLQASEGPGEHPVLGCWALVQGRQRTPLQAPGRCPGLGDARGSHGSLTCSPSHCLPVSASGVPSTQGMISAHHQQVGGAGHQRTGKGVPRTCPQCSTGQWARPRPWSTCACPL